MASFSLTDVRNVVKAPTANKGSRKRMQVEYQEQLRKAIQDGDALIVNLDPSDNPMTIRYRISAAAKALGLDVAIKKLYKKPQIVAYTASATPALAHKPVVPTPKVEEPVTADEVDADALIRQLQALLSNRQK